MRSPARRREAVGVASRRRRALGGGRSGVRCSSAMARHSRSLGAAAGSDMFRAMRSKDQVRRAVWRAMDREGVSRFPGAEGRIPNFAGAKLAAEQLAGHRLWKRAQVIKANPDSPQTHARRLALEQGKVLVMAVPRLRDQHPFRLLDPPAARPRRRSARRRRSRARCATAGWSPRGGARDRLRADCGSVAVNLKRRAGRQGRRLLRPRVRAADRGRQDRRPHRGRDDRPPDPDPAREPADDRPRPAGRPDRDAARGDRGRAAPTTARAGSSGTTSSRRRSTRSRCWSGWGTRGDCGRCQTRRRRLAAAPLSLRSAALEHRLQEPRSPTQS